MTDELQEYVDKIESSRVPWLPYGLVEGSEFRVLRADDVSNVVVLNFRMGPHTITQNHDHYCTALAYTLQGEWRYGDRVFRKGDIAYELPGETHQPVTDGESAELLTIMFGGPGNNRFLKNFEEDGSTYAIGMRLFKTVEGLTREEMEAIDITTLVDPAD